MVSMTYGPEESRRGWTSGFFERIRSGESKRRLASRRMKSEDANRECRAEKSPNREGLESTWTVGTGQRSTLAAPSFPYAAPGGFWAKFFALVEGRQISPAPGSPGRRGFPTCFLCHGNGPLLSSQIGVPSPIQAPPMLKSNHSQAASPVMSSRSIRISITFSTSYTNRSGWPHREPTPTMASSSPSAVKAMPLSITVWRLHYKPGRILGW